MGAKISTPEPEPEPEMLSMSNVTMLVAAVTMLTLLVRGSMLSKAYGKMSQRGKNNCMLSTLGAIASIACLFVEPKETYVTVESAIKYSQPVFFGFSCLFLFGAEFFFADNFTVKPKDNFGLVMTRMFGLQGLWSQYLSTYIPPATFYPMMALFNAAIIFMGPQRGELLLPTNEKHIVPHIGTATAGFVLASALL